jgi:hypothetical protein
MALQLSSRDRYCCALAGLSERASHTQVQEAYERLGGGVGDDGGSWYERLGGKGRADFFRPVDVKKEMNMELAGHWRMHVQPLDPDMTNTFLTRNAMRQA